MISPFVRVIPAIRTPLGVEEFDFSVPDELDLVVGDLVFVPFRKRATPALVRELIDASPFRERIKPVTKRLHDVRLPQATITLLHALATHTFTSSPTVLASWMRTIPKTGSPTNQHDASPCLKHPSPSHVSHWTLTPEHDLINEARRRFARGERVLILAPWMIRAKKIADELGNALLLTNNEKTSDAFRAWSSFVSGDARLLVATRLGAWLGSVADSLLIDEPENDDHKQDELTPRYDARWIAHWCEINRPIPVETFGLTPRITPRSSEAIVPTIPLDLRVHIRHPSGKTAIPMIQADTLEMIRLHDGPRLIIHPIRGTFARLVCRDCGWRATCEACGADLSADSVCARCRTCGRTSSLPLDCASCHGASLNKSWPGLVTLMQAWAAHEATISVSWRDLSNENMDAPIPKHALVLVTEATLLGGGREDVRRIERRLITFRRLASRVSVAQGALIVQCHEDVAQDWPLWLTNTGVKATMAREREERRLFGYPPAVHLTKIIVNGDEATARAWIERAHAAIGSSLQARGPFPVLQRARSRPSRWIWHLLFSSDGPSAKERQALASIARGVIVDLDPIAFFM